MKGGESQTIQNGSLLLAAGSWVKSGNWRFIPSLLLGWQGPVTEAWPTASLSLPQQEHGVRSKADLGVLIWDTYFLTTSPKACSKSNCCQINYTSLLLHTHTHTHQNLTVASHSNLLLWPKDFPRSHCFFLNSLCPCSSLLSSQGMVNNGVTSMNLQEDEIKRQANWVQSS